METELKVVLSRKQRLSHNISTFTFSPIDSTDLPSWQPGAHISVVLPGGLSRAYSLCGAAEASEWTVAVLREPAGRGGSMRMHDELTEGEVLEVTPPRNNFELQPAEEYLFIAGGIGITPLVPMIETVSKRGAKWRLIYLVRERTNAIFLDRIDLAGGNVDLRVSGEQGRYTVEELHQLVNAQTKIYACGPAELLAELQAAFPDDQLHLEHFTGDSVDTSEGGEAFDVVLAQSGQTVRVQPGVSILEAIEAADPSVFVLQSCKEGVCGSCETPVLEGTPDHRDLVLTKKQKERCDRMMLCVSRAQSQKIVLDL